MKKFLLLLLALIFVSAKDMTLEELAQYDGSDPSKPILMALKGEIFDVTSGKEFYAKDAPYNGIYAAFLYFHSRML